MEEKKEGLEQALTELAENLYGPGEECLNFARLFGEHLSTIKKQRAQGYVAGKIPVEVERPSLIPMDVMDLKADFETGKLTLPKGGKSRLLPFIRIDTSSGQTTLKIVDYGPQAAEDDAEITAGFKFMIKAVRFFNSSPANRQKFPRIYEYIKAFTRYLKGEADYSPDMKKIGEFLATVPLEAPEDLIDEVYRSSATQNNIVSRVHFISGQGVEVTEDNFRIFLTDYQSDNGGFMKIAESLKNIMKGNIRQEFTRRFLSELGSGYPQHFDGPFRPAPSLRPGAQKTESPLPLRRIVEGPMPDLDKIRRDISSGTADASTAIPAKTVAAETIQAMKIIEVGEHPAEKPEIMIEAEETPLVDLDLKPEAKARRDEFNRLAAPLLEYMMEQQKKGAKFGNRHMLNMSEMLFGSTVRWVVNGIIDSKVTEKIGLRSAFEDHPRGADEDVILVDHLFELKIAMIKKGLLNSAVKEETRGNFVKAIGRINKK